MPSVCAKSFKLEPPAAMALEDGPAVSTNAKPSAGCTVFLYELIGRQSRINPGSEERLAGVDIADANNKLLVQE